MNYRHYQISKFLGEISCRIIKSYYFITTLSHRFLLFLKKIQQVSAFNKFMISYDVCNLFTNIPLKETVKLAMNLIFKKRPEIRITRGSSSLSYLNLQHHGLISCLMEIIMIKLTMWQ